MAAGHGAPLLCVRTSVRHTGLREHGRSAGREESSRSGFTCCLVVTSGIFRVPVARLYVFFGKVSVHVLCPFLNQIVWLWLWSCEFLAYPGQWLRTRQQFADSPPRLQAAFRCVDWFVAQTLFGFCWAAERMRRELPWVLAPWAGLCVVRNESHLERYLFTSSGLSGSGLAQQGCHICLGAPGAAQAVAQAAVHAHLGVLAACHMGGLTTWQLVRRGPHRLSFVKWE